jgi:hypothetical protein
MTKEEWFEKATEFDMGICPIQKRPLFISSRKQAIGEFKWVVQLERSMCWVLGKDCEFHYEPLPSSRTDQFLKNTRFDSPDEALEFYQKNIKEEKPLHID